MKRYIAYFDYLGFKDFIEKNNLMFQKQIMNNNFRDIELSLSKGKTTDGKFGLIGDRTDCGISCMNFSDTVVFFTENNSYPDLKELIEVVSYYNYLSNILTFPTKGAIVYGELVHEKFEDSNGNNASYNINSLYGKGLVDAHIKSEQQEWAGAVIDSSVFKELDLQGNISYAKDLEPFIFKYKVPYKESNISLDEEYALRLVKGTINKESFDNLSERIAENFAQYNKGTDNPSVQRKLKNTIDFLKAFVCE